MIGYDEWQRRFNGDENIIGRQFRLGSVLHTVVGVMPGGAAEDETARLLAGTREFLNRLEAEPDIAGVAITRSFPGYEWQADLEVEGGSTLEIQYNDFGVGLLPLFVEMVAGREFTPADLGENSTAVITMMSFTVARRRREIGIRAALGAGSRQVLSGIFARAGVQLGTGVLGGLVVALAIDRVAGGMITRQLPVLLPVVAIIMMTVGLHAALGPARRGLAVQPTEALRSD